LFRPDGAVLTRISRMRPDLLVLAAWVASAVVNVLLMYVLPGVETIPFHFIWMGLSIIYGFTRWRPVGMIAVLVAVALSTGYVMAHHAAAGHIGWEEVTEVPLMSAVFIVMVWHVRRRQLAAADVARLADAERRRADVQQLFIRLASHEMRTPITVARGYTELVRGAARDPAVDDDTAVVLDELDKLTRITKRLVTLMQMDGAYTRRPADLDAELARVVRRWEPMADRDWVVRSAVGSVPINEERLEAALDCLLENAVKHTDIGDRIELTGSATADTWTIAVTDTGAGIEPARVAALNSSDAATRREAAGNGLGLAIARAVAVSWGGRLWVSGAPGSGTTVTLEFPRAFADRIVVEGLPTSAIPTSSPI
jgi:two-component system, OmpR family, sensor kinase